MVVVHVASMTVLGGDLIFNVADDLSPTHVDANHIWDGTQIVRVSSPMLHKPCPPAWASIVKTRKRTDLVIRHHPLVAHAVDGAVAQGLPECKPLVDDLQSLA